MTVERPTGTPPSPRRGVFVTAPGGHDVRTPGRAVRRRRSFIQTIFTLIRRVFFAVAGFYAVLAILGLVTSVIGGNVPRDLGPLPLIGLVIFLVVYGIFAWFAEPIYWARERRRRSRNEM